ncbi:helix-turn-helix transcriptional regulator [Desemzia sp. RIT804]|nr:helix-turn-helix transcriptional regulator [Desemzia sp. RIT 804]
MDLLYKKHLIPMLLLDESLKIIHPKTTWDAKNFSDKYLKNNSFLYADLFSDFQFMYGSFNFKDESDKKYTLLAGPCGVSGTTEDTLLFEGYEYIYGIHYTKETQHSFEEFMKLIYATITHQLLLDENIHWHYSKSPTDDAYTDKSLEINLYERRIQETTFDSYQFELRYIEYIKRKQPEKIEWLFKKMKETYHVDLSTNKLEGLKFKFSAFVAILTRTSIDEGVPINQAFGLSDALIQGLARIHFSDEWLNYMKEATYRFMELIHSHPLAEKSVLIKKIINYIDGHIYDRITINDLAESTDKHKTYLSAQFKKEMGQTIHSYIQERKVNEAKHLLLFTDWSFKEISIMLSFSSQSHFIQVFKKLEGITPREYKEQHYTYYIN